MIVSPGFKKSKLIIPFIDQKTFTITIFYAALALEKVFTSVQPVFIRCYNAIEKWIIFLAQKKHKANFVTANNFYSIFVQIVLRPLVKQFFSSLQITNSR